jgi:tetratricopeptide (TPR) repeat protein
MKTLQILTVYYATNNTDSAKRYANIMLEYGIKTKRLRFQGVAYANLAEIESQLGNYAEQIKYLIKGLQLMEGSKDVEGLMRMNVRLTEAFLASDDTTNTLIHLKKTEGYYNTLEERKRKYIYSKMNLIMGSISLKRNKPKAAIEYFNNALERISVEGVPWMKARALQSLGKTYNIMGDVTKARDFYSKALTISKDLNSHIDISACREGLASLLIKQDRTDSALVFIQQAEKMARKMNDQLTLVKVYDKYIDLYTKLGNSNKKIFYLEAKQKLRDSLNAVSFNEALADAQIKLRNHEKEKENELLNEKNKVLELEVKNSRGRILLIVIIGLGLVFVLLFRNTYQKLKSEKTNIELEHKLLRSQMNPHFMFNSLSTIQSFVLSETPIKAAKYLSLFSNLMRRTLDNSRKDYIFLEEEIDVLNSYLELEAIRMNRLMNFSFQYDKQSLGGILVPPMLIQPHLENSIKHGLKNLPENVPGEITVSFRLYEKALYCVITDNGIGINESMKLKVNSPAHQSSGIDITKKRLELLCKNMRIQYYFKISDRSDQSPLDITGTIVEFILPWKYETKGSHS